MPPPLSIPPSAMQQQLQQERQKPSTSSPNSNGSSTTDESLEADDTDFELLKTLLDDSPHQSHYMIADSGNVIANTSNSSSANKVTEPQNDTTTTISGLASSVTPTSNTVCEVDKKVSLCYRAKRVLDSWEGWQDLEQYIGDHKEEFKFLKDFKKETIKRYIQEFKRFLTLKAINEDVDDTTIAASFSIDKLWLTLIQRPSVYHSLCSALLPATKMRIMDRNPDNKHIGLVDSEFTINEYSHVYGVPPSSEFWDSSFVATKSKGTESDEIDRTMTYKEVRIKTYLANDMIFTDISASMSIREVLEKFRRERGVGRDHVKYLVVVYDGIRVNVSEENHAHVTLRQLFGSRQVEDDTYVINLFMF